uniref:Uncharacterized protein n=1 Tax=Setaria viridis TaxID=4556 RepID=A0A4U6UMR5_SETVI|nr:hypothetical protein SEVIR_5G301300v2 [Setaria viridis]
MPGLEIDSNQNPPGSALDNPIDWDGIGEWDGPANELDYDMVWNDEYQVQVLAADGQDGDQDDASADGVQAKGSNNNQRTFYSDALKIATYLELLAKTDPPICAAGVVQSIWKNGQTGGINGVVNRWSKNCGRKRIEIDLESIKDVPLSQRTTF